jgi:hypothetical protein
MTDAQSGIVIALTNVKRRVGAVGKNESPESGQKFKFRGIDTVVNAISEALIEENVVLSPISANVVETFQVNYGSGGTLGFRTIVQVRYEWRASDDSAIQAEVLAEAIDAGDKSTTKAMSVAERIAIIQTLTLPTGEKDPDNDDYRVNKVTETKQELTKLGKLTQALISSPFTKAVQADIIAAAIGRHVYNLDQLSEGECVSGLRAIESAIADDAQLKEQE